MARPVVQSSQTATATSSASVTITKPTGLAVGDFMIAFIGFENGSTVRTFTTPSGWTLLRNSASDSEGVASFYKEATAGDVAASNFTFSLSGTSDRIGGVLVRVDTLADGNEIGASEVDESGAPSGTALSFTTNLTAISDVSLYLACFFATDTTLSGTLSFSGYTITPSATVTEIADIAQGTTVGYGLAVVSAPIDSTTITNRTATASQDVTEQQMSIAVVLQGSQDGSGTTALLEPTTTLFSEAAVEVGGSGTHALLEPTTTLFTETSRATEPTVWTNEDDSSTSWTNESQL